jgi:hypothetical protein
MDRRSQTRPKKMRALDEGGGAPSRPYMNAMAKQLPYDFLKIVVYDDASNRIDGEISSLNKKK